MRGFRENMILSKRTDFDTALSVKENIIRLDISMDNALAV